jgi:diguanylate cyclase (GGDEF)-like protein
MNESMRILVVDDEPVTRMMVRRVLVDQGYEVVEAEDGAAAVAACRESAPELVLMDVRMPVMNGFDACREIRKLAGGRYLPLLMLTGLDDIMAATLAFEAGATDFVTKPINWALLGQRVRYALRTNRTERMLRESQNSLARAQRIARLAQWSKDLGADVCHCSTEMRDMLGLHGDADIRLPAVLALLVEDDRPVFVDFFERLGRGVGEQQVEVRLAPQAQGARVMAWSGSLSLDEAGRPSRIFGIVQDITERRNVEAQLNYQAHFDAPTGLPNRVLLRDRINTAIAAAQNGHADFAVLEVRTDALHKAQAAIGGVAADRVLRALADRIGNVLRERDTLCRLDGERFAVLLGDAQAEMDAASVALRLVEVFAAPLVVDAWEVLSTVTVGVALYPADGGDPDTLLAHAGAAVTRAQAGTGAAYHFFTEGIHQRVSGVIATQVALYRGLERGEFELLFQPQVELRSQRVVGVEALLRWRRPDAGLQMPDMFIPILEETGLIMEAGDWVLRSAIQAMQSLPMMLSVNISPRQLQHPHIADRLTRVLEEIGFPPQRLEVEINEQAVLQDEDHGIAALRELASRGIRVTLDDYGIGFSSLQRLKRLPLHTLKIDRFFVTSLLTDNADAAIVRSTIDLCHELGIVVVAEGVEDDHTMARLHQFGCDLAQGYGISHPLPFDALTDWLSSSRFATRQAN